MSLFTPKPQPYRQFGLHAGGYGPTALQYSEAATPSYRYLYDGYSGLNIPAAAVIVAGYPWWTQAMWDRFPRSIGVLVVQNHTMDYGDVLDVEPGCEWPITGNIEGWISRRRDAGYYRPSVYCGGDNVSAVRQATGRWVLGTDYDLWVADWRGYAFDAYAGSSATQYTSTPGYDVSCVYDAGWPHRVKPVVPAPAEPVLREGVTGTAVVKAQGLLNKHGHRLTADGVFGALTLMVTREFQLKSKLVVDGVIGSNTWKALEK
jgi:hypothetical protein